VRGSGLFLGIELMRDGQPAAQEASALVNRMKEAGVLLSTDGPYHNVIKIKPPMEFSRADADVLVERLNEVFTL
jgi:4-aminobutyrate aminotransferase-like enzyme